MASSARIDELRKKFEENPRRYFAPLANEYRKAGDIEQAIAICREYLPQQPGHMSGHIVYGQALYEARQVEEAKTVFETALSLDPENLIALRHLGDIALMIGDSQAARSWYGRVLEADPRNEEIQAQLASLDQAVSSTPTPISSSAVVEAQPAPPPSPAPAPPMAPPPTGKPSPSSAPTVVISAQPRPQATPPAPVTAQSRTAEVRVQSFSQVPTVEVKLDAVVPPAPPAEKPVDTLGLEPTSVAPPPQPASPATLAIDSPVSATREAPPIGSFSLEGLETTSLAAPPPPASAPPSPPPEVPLPAPPTPPAPALVDLDFAAPTPPASPTSPAATPTPVAQVSAPAEEEMPLLDIGELPASPATATPASAAIPVAPPAMEALPPLDASAPEPVVESATAPPESGPFVTETMAELYLQQGHREEALRVYRALLEQRPGDGSLAAKVAALSPRSAPVHSGPTIREILNAIAGRRPGTRPEPTGNGATPTPPAPATPPTQPQESQFHDALAMLFGGAQIAPVDETAAAALAVAFMDLNGLESGSAPSISGAPARHASNDLSLDAVFKGGAQPAATPSSFSFDQFFSQRATSEHSVQTGAPAESAGESRDDVAHFTQWLEGLKQK